MYPVRNSVKAIIVERGRLLCIRKSDADGFYYILPGGGQEKNETFVETVKRECVEELGAEVRVGALKYVREYIGKNHEVAGNDDDHKVEYLFECDLLGQPNSRNAIHPDDGQDGLEWIAIAGPSAYRVYPKVLMERLRSGYGEVYWGDIN